MTIKSRRRVKVHTLAGLLATQDECRQAVEAARTELFTEARTYTRASVDGTELCAVAEDGLMNAAVRYTVRSNAYAKACDNVRRKQCKVASGV